jgi:hypothetical protein
MIHLLWLVEWIESSRKTMQYIVRFCVRSVVHLRKCYLCTSVLIHGGKKKPKFFVMPCSRFIVSILLLLTLTVAGGKGPSLMKVSFSTNLSLSL